MLTMSYASEPNSNFYFDSKRYTQLNTWVISNCQLFFYSTKWQTKEEKNNRITEGRTSENLLRDKKLEFNGFMGVLPGIN